MALPVLVAIGAAAAVAVYTYISNLWRNILKARKTGLVYIVLPWSPINLLWQLTFRLWVPLIKLLPKAVWEDRLFVMIPDWAYRTGQEYFERLGTESFIAVSPGEMLLYTQHPEVIHRMTQRRDAFPKDVARYGVLSMFGHNVLTTEGALWRMHRKVTSASFNEKNAAHTFAEAIAQTRGMLDMYLGPDGERTGTTKTITSLEHDTMTWALNIIGYVGFGLRLLWPGQRLPRDIDPKMAKYGSLEPPEGHTMTFADSLAATLERIVTILIMPTVLLKYLPFNFFRRVYEAKVNYLQYMDEFLRDKIEEARRGGSGKEGMDIMGQLVQSKYGQKASSSMTLQDSDIIGNAFIMIVAGHETTANTLHFALVELANNPATQRRLQKDIDALFGTTDPAEWDYEKYVNPMMASHIGACVYETLRMMPPVTGIPKVVSHDADQTITIDGRTHVLHAGLSCSLLAVCAQRNPRWWPGPPGGGKESDLDAFVPERWYRTATTNGAESKNEEDIDDKGDYGGFQGSDVSASLYRPVRGSYIPFSDGPRSCLGRRIAMVEMNAALAVIFQQYSIELAVEEWASDEEVERMSPAERREVYAKAQAKSRETLRQANSVLTLKLHGGKHIPLRIVRRGCERFVNDPELS
ncbi:Cytochrome P450 monooxygenase [Madurella fahalii]|uniref:Cytochrome P450 monooxygenase n=1 Tax=Madurella fahalii TaxID=1157608 RepID=A0ABQ0GBE4_9PEZI